MPRSWIQQKTLSNPCLCVCSLPNPKSVLPPFSCDGLVTTVYFDVQAELVFGFFFLIHYCPVVLPTVFGLCLWYTASESMVLLIVFFRRLEKRCREDWCWGRLRAHSCSAHSLTAPQALFSRAAPQPHGVLAVSLQGLFLPRCRALHSSLSYLIRSLWPIPPACPGHSEWWPSPWAYQLVPPVWCHLQTWRGCTLSPS